MLLGSMRVGSSKNVITHQIYFFAQKWLAEATLQVLESAPGYFKKGWSIRRITDDQIKAENLQVHGVYSDAKAKDAPYFLLEKSMDANEPAFFQSPDFYQGAAQGAMVAMLGTVATIKEAKKALERA